MRAVASFVLSDTRASSQRVNGLTDISTLCEEFRRTSKTKQRA